MNDLRTVRQRCGYSVYWNRELPKASKQGEYFYIAIVHGKAGERDKLKIGTTKNPYNRFYQHLAGYKTDLTVCWISPPYSKYTTLRIEDKVREDLKSLNGFFFKRNDRFEFPMSLSEITIKVKREYPVIIRKYVEA